MQVLRRIAVTLIAAQIYCGSAAAQEPQALSALARILPADTGVSTESDALVMELALSQAVPYRVFTLNDPYRLVVDFREVDWTGMPGEIMQDHPGVMAIRAGDFRSGWSRLVVVMDQPRNISEAGMKTDPVSGSAVVRIRLEPVDEKTFVDFSGPPDDTSWGANVTPETDLDLQKSAKSGALVVVIDPGHGGIDPGAESGAYTEAELILNFARALKEALQRQDGFEVVLTRDTDEFVSLDRRIAIARLAGADAFLSLHADALSRGKASGATLYTLSEDASDVASAQLVARHDRANLMAGADLRGQDDVIAAVLMDMARTETQPRSEMLADALLNGLKSAEVRLYKSPRQRAGFSVLKAPDIPSVLIELGYMSSERDLENLLSADWRHQVVAAIVSGLQEWAETDAATTQLIRQ